LQAFQTIAFDRAALKKWLAAQRPAITYIVSSLQDHLEPVFEELKEGTILDPMCIP
jgi:hypothetical protein